MNQPASSLPPRRPPSVAERIAEALAGPGWCVVDGFLPAVHVQHLRKQLSARWRAGEFRPAAVGRGSARAVRPDLRTDCIVWLDPATPSVPERRLWRELEGLRRAFNRLLFMGLRTLEAHFALYPPGSFYRRHLDQFHGVSQRKVSVVLYLNADWRAGDGGELKLYPASAATAPCAEVLPVGGRLVCFLSDRFPHEVMPARRERLSVAGWFTTSS